MKRITMVFGVVTVMVAMLVALAAPAMAKDNGGNHNNGGRHNSGAMNHHQKELNKKHNDRPFHRFDRPFVHAPSLT
jgi:hypothetical protein